MILVSKIKGNIFDTKKMGCYKWYQIRVFLILVAGEVAVYGISYMYF